MIKLIILWVVFCFFASLLTKGKKPSSEKHFFKWVLFPVVIIILVFWCLILKPYRNWRYFKKEFINQISSLVK